MTDRQPLVSVLIPVYNHARFVEACLDSLLEDDYPRLDVVVIDDGSSDGSFDVIQRWRHRHSTAFSDFRLLRQENQGIPRTLNRLIALARGELLAFVASDDYLLPGGIRARVDALQAHPEWLAVFGDCIVVDEHGDRVHASGLSGLFHMDKQALLASPATRSLEIILNWGIPGPVYFARRDAYDQVHGLGGYDESLFVEDRDFYLRLLAREALGFIDQPVGAYRLNSGSTARSPRLRAIVDEALARSDAKHIGAFRGWQRLALRLNASVTRCQFRANRADGATYLTYRALERIFRALQRPIRPLHALTSHHGR